MTFTADLWSEISPLRTRIDELPFLTSLEDGSLPRERFDYYMAQDAAYLARYARNLAAASTCAPEPDEQLFWADGAARCIAVESTLHSGRGVDVEKVQLSPTCLAYTSYLFSLTASSSYGPLIAGILPCYWIYEDVGTRLRARAGGDTEHPYADWISTYGDPVFAEATSAARTIVDAAAARGSSHERAAMREAFVTASRYEWMFWDAAWREETWPV